MSDLDDLEEISDQNSILMDGRSRAGRKIGKGHRSTREEQSRGRFKRIKKKPITLPSLQRED